MSSARLALVVLLAALAGCAHAIVPAAPPPAFVLAEQGRAAAVIEIADGAGGPERRAAEILRDAVRTMSGAVLEIRSAHVPGRGGVVAIGFPARALPAPVASALAAQPADGFVVATSAGNLFVASGGGRGAIYGVVHLLERYFDCRRYAPGAARFPARATLALGRTFDTDRPANTVRIVHGEYVHDADYRDWMRLHDQDALYAEGFYVHTLGKLVPWQEHFAAHPEYFAWINGKRVIDQPCLSHPAVFELAVAALRAAMAAQPERRLWSVSQNDNPSYCQCAACRAVIDEEGSPAGPVIRFVNRVAALFPDRTISTLAYEYSRRAPRVTRPAPNVEVMLCTIELNRSLPIAEDPGSREFVADIEDWSRITPNLYLWDYTVNFSHHVAPFPNLHVLAPNIRFFAAHGVRRHFQQGNSGPGHEFAELKSYLLARLLWNPAVNADAVIDEFLAGYYGAAGPFVRRYIEALQAALARGGRRLDIYEPPANHADDYLSAENVAAYNALFDAAEAAVAGDAERLRRVRTARLPVTYAMIEIGKDDMFGPRGFYAEQGGRFVARPEMARLLERFTADCRAGGVRTLNEAGLTPDEFRAGVARFIDVQVEGNLAFRRTVTSDPPPSPKYAKGALAVLTNGVRGATDFKVHWLGWEGLDATLRLDLGAPHAVREITLSTLSDYRSWIFHPDAIACAVSTDGVTYRDAGTITIGGDHRGEEFIRPFTWTGPFEDVRYVRFTVTGTKSNPAWHVSAGGGSWVFIDEIVVR